jgi:ATP dependent DNA ligase domain
MWAVLRAPSFIAPCEPTLRDRLPKGEGWRYEVKFDGYRMQVHKTGRTVTLYTRNGADWTERFPHLAAPFRDLQSSTPSSFTRTDSTPSTVMSTSASRMTWSCGRST